MTTPRKRRILLVDDEDSVLQMVGKRLEMEGYEVLTAMDGHDALEQAQTESPDLIILDLVLPRLNGYSVCSVLKADPKLKKIPIVIFTGKADETEDEARLLQGADAYVRKPFRAYELLGHIHRLLNDRPAPSPDEATDGPSGLTLIEVLMAVTLLAVGVVLIVQGLGTVSRALEVAEQRATAYAFSASKLAELESRWAAQTVVEETVQRHGGTTMAEGRLLRWQAAVAPLAEAPGLAWLTLYVGWRTGPKSSGLQYRTLLAMPQPPE